ncbi:hypothetical protein DL98DRAFT_655828 [Cadophora sp. DSE1049]|nr:hypothetical protein DL98DRAFT_655828 [Cadophora sp. DSE1049]
MEVAQAEYRSSEYRLSQAPGRFNPQATEYIPRSVVYPPNFGASGHSTTSSLSLLSALKITESSETSEALRTKLESDAKKAKMDRRAAERDLAVAKADNASLQRHIQELMDDAETDRMYTEDLRRRFKEMTRENEKLAVEAKSTKLKTDEHDDRIKDLEAELQGQKENVGRLEKEIQLKDPLFQVGADVRTRFLEQAKEAFWHVKTWDKRSGEYVLKKYEVDPATIEKVNQAAHGGNGLADRSLFVLGKLSRPWATKDAEPKVKMPDAAAAHWRKPLTTEFDGKTFGYAADASESEPTNIFEELYHYRPTVYITMPSTMLEAIDCEATIKTLKSLNEGLDRPLVEKQQALENVDILVAKYPKLLKEEFDTDADVVRRVDRVRALTEMIVSYDRKKSGKASEGRIPDSSYQFSSVYQGFQG